MKHKYLFSVLTVLSWVILTAGVKAQETQQKRMHITIEENGKITKDTLVTIDKSLSEKEVQAIISGITEEAPHPCPAHQQHAMQGDSTAGRCMHRKEVEIIEISDENADGQEWVEKKVIEKKVIVTEEGEKAEKTIILESPEKTKKAEKKMK